MKLSENKLRSLIRNIIKEMAHSYGGIHHLSGIKDSNYDVYPKRNRNMKNIPNEKFSMQLDWRLKNYPGCTIHSYMFPSNLNIREVLIDNGIIKKYDRFLDITNRINEIISILSNILDENDISVQHLFNILRQSISLAIDQNNGVLIYLGSHTDDDQDPPTPFNMLHQIIDSYAFEDISPSTIKIYEKLNKIKTSIGTSILSDGVFEGIAQSKSSGSDVVFNQIAMAIGWLNPDTCTIMSNNATNPDSAGSNNPYDIVKRCLAPEYKQDEALIKKIVLSGFVELLCQAVSDFWSLFRGKVILTFSGQD